MPRPSVSTILGRFRRQTEVKRSWHDPVRNPAASEFEVDLWTLSSFLLEKLVPVVGTHPYPLNELLLMSAAACRLKPSVVFDWGTHIGASARIFSECERTFNLGYEVHTIDLPSDAAHAEHPGAEHGRLVRGLEKVHLHRGDGVKVALDIWRKLGGPKRPLFFVDGDHAYESVRDELGEIFSTVPDASVIAHDTFFQSAESNYNVGPARAIDEIGEKFPGRFRMIKSGLGLPGMTLLLSR
ncbi:cephalosporin hydroxylase [Bradyrhizobium yuanmingense]|uniref:class I SAM-dependent methyltransferase n=1 Tax=Bradyrhizobium yuanmingense TaxID=108015 RepID=UPI003511B1ED